MKTLWAGALLAAHCALFAHSVCAQSYPTKPVRVIVPIGPGGGYDLVGRALAERLTPELGQPVVVENHPGAGTTVGTNYVAKSAPDGYTLVVGGIGSIALGPGLDKALPYNPGVDFVPLQLVTSNTYTLVARGDFGPKTLPEVIAFAKANPGKLTIGTPGPATGQHVAMALLKSLAGVDMLEVQYKNAPPIYTDMMAGRVDLFFDSTPTAKSFVDGGRVRAIVTSGAERDFSLPNVPTARESGLADMVLENWLGLFAPAKTPPAVVQQLRLALNKIAQNADFQSNMRSRGSSMLFIPDVDAFVKSEIERWPPLLRKARLSGS